MIKDAKQHEKITAEAFFRNEFFWKGEKK